MRLLCSQGRPAALLRGAVRILGFVQSIHATPGVGDE